MNLKELEALRKEFGYYVPPDLNILSRLADNWEDHVWAYVEALEKEVISLREKIDDMNSRWEDIID